jgi:hypothetical protein
MGRRGSSLGEGGDNGCNSRCVIDGSSPGAAPGQRAKGSREGSTSTPNRSGAAQEEDLTGGFASVEENRPGGSVACGKRGRPHWCLCAMGSESGKGTGWLVGCLEAARGGGVR